MPSLFDQISGFQFPDVLMNSGPLPSTAGGPAGSDGSIDGVINGTGALLDNITPYAMGRSARTGSDRNYQQIPHRYQYIIPKIWLPLFHGEDHIPVSHAVDQGDIAFLLYAGSRAWWTSREQFAPRAPQCAFAGIDVVNYILACMQASPSMRWGNIREDLIKDKELFRAVHHFAKGAGKKTEFDDLYVFQAVRMLVQQLFVPHGICAGSEKQGGQHEHDGPQAVIAPVNFVITMTVDGKNIDLVNYWFDKNMLAGDELIFRLKKEKVNRMFTLSSYYKQPQSQSIDTGEKECWQLVPDVLRQEPQTPKTELCDADNAWFHHKCQGYWRIAQTFQTRARNNVHAFTRGTPLEVTFAPMWQSFLDCRDVVSHGNHSVVVGAVHHVQTTTAKKLYSVASKHSLCFWYGEEGAMKDAFKISSSQTHYTITFDAEVCKVYADGFMKANAGFTFWKHELPCLHVLFHDKGEASIEQKVKPHGEKKDSKLYDPTDSSTYAKTVPCTMAFTTTILEVGSSSAKVGEYIVNLTIDGTSKEHLYDADFLRSYTHQLGHIRQIAGNYYAKNGTNYENAFDKSQILVDYKPKHAASALSSSSGGGDTSIVRLDGPRGAEASASDAMHLTDFSHIGGLGADASAEDHDIAHKAPKRVKKIKFLQPEPGPAPG